MRRTATKVRDAVTTIAQRTNVDIQTVGFGADGSMPTSAAAGSSASSPGDEQVSLETGPTYASALTGLATRLEQASGKYGRGMMLIRSRS